MAAQGVLTKYRVPDYSGVEQLPDPPSQPDMMKQMPAITVFVVTLGWWFSDRDDAAVGAGGYLWRTPYDRDGPFPDGTFVKGVEGAKRIPQRNGYVISEIGKPPDLVLEIGSASTGRRDYTVKREIYEEYGVGEYWRFDPSGGEFHDAPLAGDTLVDGRYERIEIVREPDGRHWGYSEALELEFWWIWDETGWNEGALRFRDPVSGEFLLTYEESARAAELAEARADFERAAREGAAERAAWIESERLARLSAEGRAASAEAKLDFERTARERAEARMAEMEAELRRLRGE